MTKVTYDSKANCIYIYFHEDTEDTNIQGSICEYLGPAAVDINGDTVLGIELMDAKKYPELIKEAKRQGNAC